MCIRDSLLTETDSELKTDSDALLETDSEVKTDSDTLAEIDVLASEALIDDEVDTLVDSEINSDTEADWSSEDFIRATDSEVLADSETDTSEADTDALADSDADKEPLNDSDADFSEIDKELLVDAEADTSETVSYTHLILAVIKEAMELIEKGSLIGKIPSLSLNQLHQMFQFFCNWLLIIYLIIKNSVGLKETQLFFEAQ